MERQLEKKVFYRLVRVVLITSFFIGSTIILIIGWSEKPYKNLSLYSSYIRCNNGDTYNLSGNNLWLDGGRLNQTSDKRAREICAGVTKDQKEKFTKLAENQGYDYVWIQNEINRKNKEVVASQQASISSQKNYKLEILYNEGGKWDYVFGWWSIGLFVLYASLDTFYEVLLYIVYGRKIEWEWFFKIKRLFSDTTVDRNRQ